MYQGGGSSDGLGPSCGEIGAVSVQSDSSETLSGWTPYGSASTRRKERRQRDGMKSGTIITSPAAASTPLKSIASNPVPKASFLSGM